MPKSRKKTGPKPDPLSYSLQLNLRLNKPVMKALGRSPGTRARDIVIDRLLEDGKIGPDELPISEMKGRAKR